MPTTIFPIFRLFFTKRSNASKPTEAQATAIWHDEHSPIRWIRTSLISEAVVRSLIAVIPQIAASDLAFVQTRLCTLLGYWTFSEPPHTATLFPARSPSHSSVEQVRSSRFFHRRAFAK